MQEDVIITYIEKIYVPNSNELKNMVLREMHIVSYAGHLGYQKKITFIRSQYFWSGMKKEVANYIARCLECQKVKINHRHPSRMLQPLLILEWKWKWLQWIYYNFS